VTHHHCFHSTTPTFCKTPCFARLHSSGEQSNNVLLDSTEVVTSSTTHHYCYPRENSRPSLSGLQLPRARPQKICVFFFLQRLQRFARLHRGGEQSNSNTAALARLLTSRVRVYQVCTSLNFHERIHKKNGIFFPCKTPRCSQQSNVSRLLNVSFPVLRKNKQNFIVARFNTSQREVHNYE